MRHVVAIGYHALDLCCVGTAYAERAAYAQIGEV